MPKIDGLDKLVAGRTSQEVRELKYGSTPPVYRARRRRTSQEVRELKSC